MCHVNSEGLHILLTMFTGYMFGYAIFRSQLPDFPSMHASGGVGVIVGISMEMLLFITRASLSEKSSEMQVNAKLKAEQVLLQSSTEPSVPLFEVQSEVPVPVSEIQAEPELSFGVQKRRGLVQPTA